MIIRKLGKILRGDASPFQLVTACVLGAMLGFMPGFQQAPGPIALLTLLLILLNANFALAVISGALAKLLSLALMPLSFAVGRMTIDGPLQSLATAAINAPVLALFGFEYYVTTGGLIVGAVAGALFALTIVKAIGGFRHKMATLEEESDKFKELISKKWVKALLFIFAGGGHGKKTYQEILEKKGKPIRPLGLAFAALFLALLGIALMFTRDDIVLMALERGLERANGATVDVGSAELDLKEGRLTVTNLAMADADALDRDLLRAAKVDGDVSTSDLLRKRIRLERVQVSDASHGEARAVPGRRLREAPPAPPPPPEPEGEGEKLSEILRKAEEWKERIEELKKWLGKVSGPEDPTEEGGKEETLAERLAREVRELGYAAVRAHHLIEGSPTLLVSLLLIDEMKIPSTEGRAFRIEGKNLSTHPSLVTEAPSVGIEVIGLDMKVDLTLGEAAASDAKNTVELASTGFLLDDVAEELSIGDKFPFKGGTVDVTGKGDWSLGGAGSLDLPLQAVIRDTALLVPKLDEVKVDRLDLTLGLHGSLLSPRVKFDYEQIAAAIEEAAGEALKAKASEEIDKAKEKLKGKLAEKLGDEGAEELTKKAEEALGKEKTEELKDKGKQLFEGLFKKK